MSLLAVLRLCCSEALIVVYGGHGRNAASGKRFNRLLLVESLAVLV